ncbi:MAG: hypothetical protein ABI565_09285 [Vicinamibacteria bacterium]
MNNRMTQWIAAAVASLCVSGFAQAPANAPAASVLGQVETVDATARVMKIKTEGGDSLSVALAEKGTVVKVAPGETSLLNAAPIAFDGINAGDRVLVRGGIRSQARIEGALRIVIMARTDLAARNESELEAWQERGVAGTLISADAEHKQFILQTSTTLASAPAAPGAPAAPKTLVIDAKNATMHRYADTSVRFDDAKPATVADMSAADQVRVLGTKSADGKQIAAERVVFGSFRTMALSIEKIDPETGVLNVKELESNRKFEITLGTGATIRRIPAEMVPMLAMLSGGGRPGGMGAGGARPEGARPEGPGGMAGGAGPGGRGPGGPRSARGAGNIIDRMPNITLADLKKDDWIGAVVGKIGSSGRAVAFNLLAGIEVFAARANRGGGVDVGMPAGLLDGALGVP